MNDQLVQLAGTWAEANQDFLPNFLGMIQEYRQLAIASGVELDELTLTKACLTQVSELFEAFNQLEVSNG